MPGPARRIGSLCTFCDNSNAARPDGDRPQARQASRAALDLGSAEGMRGDTVILFAIGLPGRFAEWCDSVVARLVGELGGAVVCKTWPSLTEMFGYEAIAPTLDELGRVLIGNDAEHLVIGARQPDAALRRALAERNTRFLVVLDDPRNAVADIVAETGCDLKMAVRAVANSCPLVMLACRLAGALQVNADHARSDPQATIATIAAHFGIDVGPDTIAAIADELAAQASLTLPAGETLLAGLAPGTRNMLDGALLGYRDLFFTGNLGQLVWARDLFALAADPGASLGEPIDVAGGTRLLIFGPYIQLPGGSWTAQVVLGFSAEAAVHTFLVDVYAEGQLAATTFRPEVAGIYRAELAFSVGEPGGKGVEVRIGVIDHDGRGSGQVAFGQVVLRLLAMRHTEETAPAGEDFTLVLAL